MNEQAPNALAAEANLVAAVAELDAIAKDIRFMHRGELADRLDAIIARRFGYVVRHVGEELKAVDRA